MALGMRFVTSRQRRVTSEALNATGEENIEISILTSLLVSDL
jgi:hypothetical protein